MWSVVQGRHVADPLGPARTAPRASLATCHLNGTWKSASDINCPTGSGRQLREDDVVVVRVAHCRIGDGAVESDLFVNDELIQSIRRRGADLAAHARVDAELFIVDKYLDRARAELIDLKHVVLRRIVES